MMYLLITVIIQHGQQEAFFTNFKNYKNCSIAREEAEKHNNEVTRVAAFCMKK
jgi:hypothetical protein